jgi:hypothetical protein
VCRRRASLITARGEIARTAVAPTSASITDAGASARTAGALASASITAREESAGTAGARRDKVGGECRAATHESAPQP